MAFTPYAPKAAAPAPTGATPGFTPYTPPATSLPPAKTPFQSPLQNIQSGNSQDNVDVAKGALKGVISSIASIGAQNSGPVGADMLAHAPALAADLNGLTAKLKPANLPQAVGAANEKLAEAAIPVEAGVSAATDALDAVKLKSTNPDILTGTITQGKLADVPAAKSALASVDTSKVKTYADLANALHENVENASGAQDTFLAKTSTPTTLDKLTTTTKVGDQSITHNYVQDALSHLKELYSATNDPANAAKVSQLETKAQNVGLTPKEVNDLARTYGSEFGSKAFGKTGDPLTSVNAQALENTRSGLKSMVADLSGDRNVFASNDKVIADNIKTRDLVKSVSEKVNQLQQRVTQRGWGEQFGRVLGKVMDAATGHILKGAFQSFIPRSQGFKVMNALDLQANLSRNLETLQRILNDPSITEAQATKLLQDASGSPKP